MTQTTQRQPPDAWTAIQTTTQQHEPSPCDPDATCFTTVPTPVHPRCQLLLAAMPPVRDRLDPPVPVSACSPSLHTCSSFVPVDSQDRIPLQLSGSLPRPTSGRNVTSGRRPTLLAARLALHTTLVKQPLASPSWSIVPVARACAHQQKQHGKISKPTSHFTSPHYMVTIYHQDTITGQDNDHLHSTDSHFSQDDQGCDKQFLS